MRYTNIFLTALLVLVLTPFSTLSRGDENKRQWQTSACFHFSLSVWDKKSQGRYVAKYVVTSADGRVFTAEKKATDDSSSADVIFPDNFRDKSTNNKAWVNCNYGESYAWEIYANGTLVENGTFVISRKKPK